jgi:hypothetical protein
METTQLLIQIKNDIAELKQYFQQTSFASPVSEKWIPRAKVMEFLNYGETQMTAFEKSNEIEISRIGRRKFINRESLAKLLNKNLVCKSGSIN